MNSVNVAEKNESLQWYEEGHEPKQKPSENTIALHGMTKNENYLGYIEVCFLADTKQFSIQGIIRTNYLKGLPKWTILNENHFFHSWAEAMSCYLSLKSRISAFMR